MGIAEKGWKLDGVGGEGAAKLNTWLIADIFGAELPLKVRRRKGGRVTHKNVIQYLKLYVLPFCIKYLFKNY